MEVREWGKLEVGMMRSLKVGKLKVEKLGSRKSWKLGKVDSPVCHVVPELVSLVVESGHFERKIRGAAPPEWSMGRLVGTCHEAASLFLVPATLKCGSKSVKELSHESACARQTNSLPATAR